MARFSEKNTFRLLLCAVVAALVFPGCRKTLSDEEKETLRRERIAAARNTAVERFVQSLPFDERLSQIFLVNVEGNRTFVPVEKNGILHGAPGTGDALVPGGALLFSYNISKDPLETYEFIRSIHDFYIHAGKIPPYIAVDQEGGDVNRLRGLTSVLWSQKKVAESFSPVLAQELYSVQAAQMRMLGFSMNLAPVAEVADAENAEFLGTRTFGNIDSVVEYGTAAVLGYEKNGISTVLKHFPGNSRTDPHSGLPEITITNEAFDGPYLKSFAALLPLSSAVLMSHARVSVSGGGSGLENVGSVPACFSDFWIGSILRERFSFSGLVISDDIFMAALSDNGFSPEQAAVRAVESGIDVILLSEKTFGTIAAALMEKAAADANFEAALNRSVCNVIKYKIKAGILLMEDVSAAGTNSIEKNAENGTESAEYDFSVVVNTEYHEFNLHEFDALYRKGMSLYE